MYGRLIIFGSGETLNSGVTIQRKVLSTFSKKVNVAILETPAGFQPNSQQVAKEIADIFNKNLSEFTKEVSIIPARKKNNYYSCNNPKILSPIARADYIFVGPGSPTYAVKQLKDSLVLKKIVHRFKHGTTICFSSAGALAAGFKTLPVYEIYKVGADLFWEDGLNIAKNILGNLIFITHFNNNEGGKKVDTKFCYMGYKRFKSLQKLLDPAIPLIGIDENTALIIDNQHNLITVLGKGNVTAIFGSQKILFSSGGNFYLDSFLRGKKKISDLYLTRLVNKVEKDTRYKIAKKKLPKKIQTLLNIRYKFKKDKKYQQADKIRYILKKRGFEIRDTKKGQIVYHS